MRNTMKKIGLMGGVLLFYVNWVFYTKKPQLIAHILLRCTSITIFRHFLAYYI